MAAACGSSTSDDNNIDNFQSFMVEISGEIGEGEFLSMVDLCADKHIQKAQREKIRRDGPYKLLEKLKETGKLSKTDPTLLIVLLKKSGRSDLAESVEKRFKEGFE
ncbi:uncharacterized protein LOC144359205 [Saccoglossus kowalevskii]